MGLFDRLFRGKAAGDNLVPFAVSTNSMNLRVDESASGVDQYAGWVYACVKAIAQDVSAVKLRLVRKKANGDIEDVSDKHEAHALLKSVNSSMTMHDLLFATHVFKQLTGSAYWYVVKNKANQPLMIWPLLAHKVKAIAGTDKFIEKYIYEPSYGKKFEIPSENIVAFREFNPTSFYKGYSPTQAAITGIVLDNYVRAWNREFFKNGAMPGMVFEVPAGTKEADIRMMKRLWDDQHRGVENAHRVAFVTGGTKATTAGASQKDMDFVNLKKDSRDEILAIYGVPRTRLGITDEVNRANAEATEYVYTKNTVKPEKQSEVDVLNEVYLKMFSDSQGLEYVFDDPVPANREMQLLAYEKGLQNGFYSINEVRRWENLPPVENGDAVMVNFSLTPLGKPEKSVVRSNDVSSKDVRPLGPEDKTISPAAMDLAKMIAAGAKFAMSQEEFEKRGEVWQKSQVDRGNKYEKKVIKAVMDYFEGAEDRVLTALENEMPSGKGKAAKAKTPDVFDPEAEKALLIEAVEKLFQTIIAEEGDAALEEAGIDAVFNARLAAVQTAIARDLRKFAGGVSEETEKRVKDAIVAGFKEGEGITEITKRIRDAGAFDRVRAEVIARTETTRAQNFASVEAWKQSDLVAGKIWYTALDERVEPNCAALHGKEFKLTATITKTEYGPVKEPPLHPNCRCTLLPVLDESKAAQPVDIKEAGSADLMGAKFERWAELSRDE